MDSSTPVQHCAGCRRVYDAQQLICRECDLVLELPFFNLFVLGTLGPLRPPCEAGLPAPSGRLAVGVALLPQRPEQDSNLRPAV